MPFLKVGHPGFFVLQNICLPSSQVAGPSLSTLATASEPGRLGVGSGGAVPLVGASRASCGALRLVTAKEPPCETAAAAATASCSAPPDPRGIPVASR